MRQPSFPRALTFVEVLVALLLFASCFLGLYSIFGGSHGALRGTIDEVNAANLASEMVETIQALPFEVLGPYDDVLPNQADGLAVAFPLAQQAGYRVGSPAVPPGFTVHLSVQEHPVESSVPAGLPPAVVERVASAAVALSCIVEVSWLDKGRPARVVVKTLRGRY